VTSTQKTTFHSGFFGPQQKFGTIAKYEGGKSHIEVIPNERDHTLIERFFYITTEVHCVGNLPMMGLLDTYEGTPKNVLNT
jgi:hypothetical protein